MKPRLPLGHESRPNLRKAPLSHYRGCFGTTLSGLRRLSKVLKSPLGVRLDSNGRHHGRSEEGGQSGTRGLIGSATTRGSVDSRGWNRARRTGTKIRMWTYCFTRYPLQMSTLIADQVLE